MTRRMQLADDKWEFIEPHLSIGRYGPVSRAAAAAVRGRDVAVQDSGQWREMPKEFGA
jgi:hypothetical protein